MDALQIGAVVIYFIRAFAASRLISKIKGYKIYIIFGIKFHKQIRSLTSIFESKQRQIYLCFSRWMQITFFLTCWWRTSKRNLYKKKYKAQAQSKKYYLFNKNHISLPNSSWYKNGQTLKNENKKRKKIFWWLCGLLKKKQTN